MIDIHLRCAGRTSVHMLLCWCRY